MTSSSMAVIREHAAPQYLAVSPDAVRELQQSGHAMFVRKRGSPFPVMPAAFFGVRRDDEAEVAVGAAAAASQPEQQQRQERAEGKLAASRVYWTAGSAASAQRSRADALEQLRRDFAARSPAHASLLPCDVELALLGDALRGVVVRVVPRGVDRVTGLVLCGAVVAAETHGAEAGADDGERARREQLYASLSSAGSSGSVLNDKIREAAEQVQRRRLRAGGDVAGGGAASSPSSSSSLCPAAAKIAIDRAAFDALATDDDKKQLLRHHLFCYLLREHLEAAVAVSGAMVEAHPLARLLELLLGGGDGCAELEALLARDYFPEQSSGDAGGEGDADGVGDGLCPCPVCASQLTHTTEAERAQQTPCASCATNSSRGGEPMPAICRSCCFFFCRDCLEHQQSQVERHRQLARQVLDDEDDEDDVAEEATCVDCACGMRRSAAQHIDHHTTCQNCGCVVYAARAYGCENGCYRTCCELCAAGLGGLF